MARMKKRQWKNGTYPNWTCRIRWFDSEADGIRLNLEDCECSMNVYPRDEQSAEHVYQMFRQGAPEEGVSVPFVRDLLQLARQPGGPLHEEEKREELR